LTFRVWPAGIGSEHAQGIHARPRKLSGEQA
jgi:hypothetical protein